MENIKIPRVEKCIVIGDNLTAYFNNQLLIDKNGVKVDTLMTEQEYHLISSVIKAEPWSPNERNKFMQTGSDLAAILESCVLRRFKDIEELCEKLSLRMGIQVNLEDKTRYEDEDYMDFNLIGNIRKDEMYYDIDIYYLRDNENNLLITEVCQHEII